MPLLDQLRDRLRSSADRTEMGGPGPYDPLPAPVSSALLADAEATLGFRLPDVLRDIYVTIGNGGFGPGYGLLGLAGGHTFSNSDDGLDIVRLYRSFRHGSRRQPLWDEGLLPICHWGCCYFSYIDCALPAAPMFAFNKDAHGHGPLGCAFGLHAASLEDWLRRWASGEELWDSFSANGAPIFWFEEQQAGANGRADEQA